MTNGVERRMRLGKGGEWTIVSLRPSFPGNDLNEDISSSYDVISSMESTFGVDNGAPKSDEEMEWESRNRSMMLGLISNDSLGMK